MKAHHVTGLLAAGIATFGLVTATVSDSPAPHPGAIPTASHETRTALLTAYEAADAAPHIAACKPADPLAASYAVVHDHGSPSTYTTTAARAWDQSARGWVWVRAWCEKETK